VPRVFAAEADFSVDLGSTNSPDSETMVAVTKISRYRGESISVRRRKSEPMIGMLPRMGTDSTNVAWLRSSTPPMTTVSPVLTPTRVESSCVRISGRRMSNLLVTCPVSFTSETVANVTSWTSVVTFGFNARRMLSPSPAMLATTFSSTPETILVGLPSGTRLEVVPRSKTLCLTVYCSK
jgi:hypothetical protein